MVRIKDVLKVTRESTNAAQPRSVGVLFLVALAALRKTAGREYTYAIGGFDVEENTAKTESLANAKLATRYICPHKRCL
jgi:hypothetical protein